MLSSRKKNYPRTVVFKEHFDPLYMALCDRQILIPLNGLKENEF